MPVAPGDSTKLAPPRNGLDGDAILQIRKAIRRNQEFLQATELASGDTPSRKQSLELEALRKKIDDDQRKLGLIMCHCNDNINVFGHDEDEVIDLTVHQPPSAKEPQHVDDVQGATYEPSRKVQPDNVSSDGSFLSDSDISVDGFIPIETYNDMHARRYLARLHSLSLINNDSGLDLAKHPPMDIDASTEDSVLKHQNISVVSDSKLTAVHGSIMLSSLLSKALLPYQLRGVRWLHSLFHLQRGGILADEAGVGKSLQCIAFLSCLFLSRAAHSALFVVPATLITQWVEMFHNWWPYTRTIVLNSAANSIIGGESRASSGAYDSAGLSLANTDLFGHLYKEASYLKSNCAATGFTGTAYFCSYDFVVANYVNINDLFARVNHINAPQAKAEASPIRIAIFDEMHYLKNNACARSIALRRLCVGTIIGLSATPIQNDFCEIFSLLDFIQPGYLGDKEAFDTRYNIPIKRGTLASASFEDMERAFHLAQELSSLVKPFLLRRLKTHVESELPGKTEYMVSCRLTASQEEAYCSILEDRDMQDYRFNILQNRHTERMHRLKLTKLVQLQHVCNHPLLLTESDSEICKKVKKLSELSESRKTRCRVSDTGNVLFSDTSDDLSASEPAPTETLCSSDNDIVSSSTKLRFLVNKLREIHGDPLARGYSPNGEKTLVFSQGTKMLNVLEAAMQREGYSYLRMDGQTPMQRRQALVRTFSESSHICVFLLTTKVGGLGLNITAAQHLFVYDPHWNPAVDDQSMERCWRIGQTRDVEVYRLVTAGTIESRIYDRQIYKKLLSSKVMSAGIAVRASAHGEKGFFDLFQYERPDEEYAVKKLVVNKKMPRLNERASSRNRGLREDVILSNVVDSVNSLVNVVSVSSGHGVLLRRENLLRLRADSARFDALVREWCGKKLCAKSKGIEPAQGEAPASLFSLLDPGVQDSAEVPVSDITIKMAKLIVERFAGYNNNAALRSKFINETKFLPLVKQASPEFYRVLGILTTQEDDTLVLDKEFRKVVLAAVS